MSGAIAGAVLLVAAVTALGAAALRVASLATTDGLERAVAAAPLFVACAVVEALALGAVGLGGSGIALALAAAATWLVARRFVPSAAAAEPIPRVALIGLIALWAGWVVWALRFPYLGLDGSTYHLSAVAEWVINGTTGHSLDLYARIPVGSYPLTGETAVAWAVGLAHSFAPVALWTASVVVLLVSAAWVGLRALAVPPLRALLAIAALCLVPVALRGLVGAETDLPAVAWLVTAGALVACARARPALLAPAVVAAGLAIGTKTTTLPLAVLVVAAGAYAGRASLRRLALPFGLALGLGFAAGGLWYLRNLLAHGSPLWPFVSAPWGDPVPPLLGRVNYSLLERPRATLEGQWAIYRVTLSGGLVLLAGGLLAPLWARRRAVIAAAAVTLFAVLTWSAAPFTGAGAAPFLQVNTLRYLVPAMAAGALALALSGRCAVLVLLASIAWSAKTYLDNPYLPGEGTLIVVASGGGGGRRPSDQAPALARNCCSLRNSGARTRQRSLRAAPRASRGFRLRRRHLVHSASRLARRPPADRLLPHPDRPARRRPAPPPARARRPGRAVRAGHGAPHARLGRGAQGRPQPLRHARGRALPGGNQAGLRRWHPPRLPGGPMTPLPLSVLTPDYLVSGVVEDAAQKWTWSFFSPLQKDSPQPLIVKVTEARSTGNRAAPPLTGCTASFAYGDRDDRRHLDRPANRRAVGEVVCRSGDSRWPPSCSQARTRSPDSSCPRTEPCRRY